ncbi:hypothetical protein NKH34_09110 [Mesorhizobium sp. M1148]|uniref:hypothetical protein n=1 Tax=unclassified Mesorhizobium TaxID=325217 RepID=UPI003336234F
MDTIKFVWDLVPLLIAELCDGSPKMEITKFVMDDLKDTIRMFEYSETHITSKEWIKNVKKIRFYYNDERELVECAERLFLLYASVILEAIATEREVGIHRFLIILLRAVNALDSVHIAITQEGFVITSLAAFEERFGNRLSVADPPA